MGLRALIAAVAGTMALLASPGSARGPVDILHSVSALTPHISGRFEEPIGFAQTTTGDYIVLDRRAHTLYAIDAKQTTVRKVRCRFSEATGVGQDRQQPAPTA